ncbi:MAG: glycosyltransferase family 2 protein [Muribaculaceae bacterium]|nr:glycosyltransferase family 2 protein [Muribaculaceae bacterium]
MTRPSSSLIVTTYNSPRFLELSMRSVFNQRMLPDEILVADDGSGEETRMLVEELAVESFVPVRHIWQPDEGFRAGAIRNRAIEAAKGEYIIQIDGDMILHPAFVKDHIAMAKRGTFVCGSRVMLDRNLTETILNTGRIDLKPGEEGIKSPINGRRMKLLTPFFARYKASDGTYARSCNMACWRDDLMLVNGYNEDIRGWGREDSELSWRLINAGVKKRFLKFGAIQYHLDHKENSKDLDPRNIELMERTRREKLTWAKNGIIKADER